MKFLRKILLALGLILLLAFLKVVFKKHFPHSTVFHYNLLSSLQVMLLFWAIITGLLELWFWKKQPPATAHARSLFLFLFFMALVETGCYWIIHHPSFIPDRFLIVSRSYYNNYQRDLLQFNQDITRYDPALFYRMKSSQTSVFSNIEFSDSISTNTHGFRDDETSLDHPAIVCLGDSYTLGWGVRQNECFSALLQHMLKTPVLNTGMSSYGTAREIASIQNMDKKSISTVVIQYCYNDAEENEAFVKNNFHPLISSAAVYDSAVDMLKWSKTWFPGKYVCTLFKLYMAGLKESSHPPGDKTTAQPSLAPDGHFDREAAWFIDVLKRSDLNFDSTQVFVFDICEYQQLTGQFVDALKKKLAEPDNRSIFKDHVHTLHIEKLLTPADYYRLDEHIRPSGHLKIARLLADSILYLGQRTYPGKYVAKTGLSCCATIADTSAAPSLVK